MNLRSWITGLFEPTGAIQSANSQALPDTNPATGLPMAGGVDAAGNPFGYDLRRGDNTHYASNQPIGGFSATFGTVGSSLGDGWHQTMWPNSGY